MCAEEFTVFLVDPDEAVHDALTTLFRASGTRVECFTSAEEYLDSGVVFDARNGCILVEASLPGIGCLALLRRLQADGPNIPVIVLTSTSNRDIFEQVVKAGALEVIEKPLLSDRLLQRLLPVSCNWITTATEREI